NPRGVCPADHNTPSLAAIAIHASGTTNALLPLGPMGNGSLEIRANMTSTPMCFCDPRGEPKPSLMTGARPSQRGTGQPQRPASWTVGVGDLGAGTSGVGGLGEVVIAGALGALGGLGRGGSDAGSGTTGVPGGGGSRIGSGHGIGCPDGAGPGVAAAALL